MNTAKRLLSISKKVRSTNHNGKAIDTWKLIFQLTDREDSNYQVLRYFTELIRLTYTIEEQIKSIDNLNYDLFIKPIEEVRNAFIGHNFYGNWKDFQTKFNPQTIRGLEFVDDAISKIYQEEEIDNKKLSEINSNIEELFSEIMNENINQTIKTYILCSLSEIS